MHDHALKNLSIFHVGEGLREGISHFSGVSRVALVYAVDPGDPICIHDPQNLLAGHEPKLKEIYLEKADYKRAAPRVMALKPFEPVLPEKNLQLTGLISFGGRSRSLFYQMWFTEHHPDMCSIGPTERWLEHATWLLSHDFAAENAFNSGASGYLLREYATHAVRDYIVDQLNVILGWDVSIRVYPILDSVLGISKTMEEGAWPRGEIAFLTPKALAGLNHLASFPKYERPGLSKHKHVRKLLLSVEGAERSLVSDGKDIVGIAMGRVPEALITADFQGGHGFLSVGGEAVCSFFDGRFHSSTRKANLVQLEEILLETDLDSGDRHELFRTVAGVVHAAETSAHGATLVLNLGSEPVDVAGLHLEEPLDLRHERHLDLIKALSHLDGALYLTRDLQLKSFACILDGRSVAGEDRARGARYNSALRFTAEHPDLVVIVVSSDRPVSVIQQGMDLSAQCEWEPVSGFMPPPKPLEEWIRR